MRVARQVLRSDDEVGTDEHATRAHQPSFSGHPLEDPSAVDDPSRRRSASETARSWPGFDALRELIDGHTTPRFGSAPNLAGGRWFRSATAEGDPQAGVVAADEPYGDGDAVYSPEPDARGRHRSCPGSHPRPTAGYPRWDCATTAASRTASTCSICTPGQLIDFLTRTLDWFGRCMPARRS